MQRANTLRINVILNWFEELKQRVPPGRLSMIGTSLGPYKIIESSPPSDRSPEYPHPAWRSCVCGCGLKSFGISSLEVHEVLPEEDAVRVRLTVQLGIW